MPDEFGSDEHVRSLSREELESLFRYVFNSRNDLNTIITMQSKEIYELYEKVANQSKQLKAVQVALEKRNQGEVKARWQRAMDALKAETERLSEEVRYLKKGDVLHVLTDQEYIDQCERERLMQASIDALDKENAKLRELLRAAWKCIHSGPSCFDCRVVAGGCTLESAMRELGVEVYE